MGHRSWVNCGTCQGEEEEGGEERKEKGGSRSKEKWHEGGRSV